MQSLELKKIAAISAVYKYIEEIKMQQIKYAEPEKPSIWKMGSRLINLQNNQLKCYLK